MQPFHDVKSKISHERMLFKLLENNLEKIK